MSTKEPLSTGSTLLNLACADNPHGCLLRGKYYFFVGDSASGKTFLAITCLAEAVLNRRFRRYRLIYDNIEDGCLLDLDTLFNEAVADRIEPPSLDADGNPVYSSTVEEFYYNVDDAVKAGRPFVYVLDSMDALVSDASEEKFEQQKKATRAGKDAPGSYGDGKAKQNSQNLRRVLKGIRDSGSILVILSQTRDNFGFGFDKKSRAGGHALRFYATVEVWTSIRKHIKRTVQGKPREIGVRVKLAVKKNRITGKRAEVEVDIYPSYGIDDIGSVVDYLVEEKWWARRQGSIAASEFEVTGTREQVIQHIEDNHLQVQMRELAGKCWNSVAEACALKRAKRYEVGTD